jgi:UDP-2,4-diacetamido-2,4,6-trideoxy-beta-L-altropyranose hydrolase
MRCLAIADAVKSLGEDVTFLKADEYENDRIVKAGHAIICLNSDWKDMEGELPVLKEYIAENNISSILIDSYQVTTTYMEELHQLVKVFYMDDLADQAYPADVVINYALADYNKIYQKFYPDKRTKCLLGSKYAPLRKAFQEIKPRSTKENISDILVTTGGSDPYYILYLAATKLAAHANCRAIMFHLVLGAFVEEHEAEQIIQEADYRGNIKYYRNISNMEELMQQCDLAISAAGSTLYELCACQTPTICFAFADNQLPGIMAMRQTSVMSTIGDIREKNAEQIEAELVEEIDGLQPVDIRAVYATKMHLVTDGLGAIRLAKELLAKNLVETKDNK